MLRTKLTLAGLVAATALLAPSESLANPGAPYISYNGQSGHGVTCVQEILYYCTGHYIKLDGIYGPETRGAVIDLQKFFSLGVDGIVGPRTGDALKLVGTQCKIPGWGVYDLWNANNCEPDVPTSR